MGPLVREGEKVDLTEKGTFQLRPGRGEGGRGKCSSGRGAVWVPGPEGARMTGLFKGPQGSLPGWSTRVKWRRGRGERRGGDEIPGVI